MTCATPPRSGFRDVALWFALCAAAGAALVHLDTREYRSALQRAAASLPRDAILQRGREAAGDIDAVSRCRETQDSAAQYATCLEDAAAHVRTMVGAEVVATRIERWSQAHPLAPALQAAGLQAVDRGREDLARSAPWYAVTAQVNFAHDRSRLLLLVDGVRSNVGASLDSDMKSLALHELRLRMPEQVARQAAADRKIAAAVRSGDHPAPVPAAKPWR